MQTIDHDRRLVSRWPVRLLAKCLRDTRDHAWETDVEVKDVHENGLRLAHSSIDDEAREAPAPHAGWNLVVRGFFYDEKGEKAMPVRVRWVHAEPDGAWSAGVQFTDEPKGRSSCFRDFLRVVRFESE